jgi:perosamine synthetase
VRPIYSGYLVDKATGGPKAEEFERTAEDYYAVDHARVFNSGTSALHAALVAVGVRRGDEVICPSYTMSGTATSILHAGAQPVFADIGPNYCLDWDSVLRALTPRTSAIVLVHLFGHHATVPEWAARFPIVHDCAQSPTVAPFAGWPNHVWAYSLNQHKIITCGEGGYALAYERQLADRMHAVRNHGECHTIDIVGHNYRMTEMQAEVALDEFVELDWRIRMRREWAAEFGSAHNISDPGNRDWFVFPVRCDSGRSDVARRLGGRVGYVRPAHQMPWFQANGYSDVMLPYTERVESEIVVVDPLEQ